VITLFRLSLLAVAGLLSSCTSTSITEPSTVREPLATYSTSQKSPNGNAPAAPAVTANEPAGGAATQSRALQKAAVTLTSVSDPTSSSYKIGPRDVLEVSVFEVPELSKTVQVSEAGTISYPLVGEARAGGKTAREVEQELTRVLGDKYLKNPQVTVLVKEYNSQRITVEGAVKKPGVYPIAGGMSLLQAIATAGGFEQTAEETVLLFRQSDGRRLAARFDVARIRTGRDQDFDLQAGDVLIAPTSDLKEGFNTVLRLVPLATLVPLL
jgi:polysaccharide biosynthesis/export protein